MGVNKVFLKYAKEVVHVFINLSGKSVYPGVGWLDIGTFSEDSRIIDQVKVKVATVDRMIIAASTANVDETPSDEVIQKGATKAEMLKIKPEGALVRF